MKLRFSLFFILGILLLLDACGSSKPSQEALDIPTDLPEICRDIDFVAQPDMREPCGVRVSRYQGYKNIALQRYLVNPKNASLVKTNGKVQLRLPNTLPVHLDSSFAAGIDFAQEKRLQPLRNTMEYKELFPAGGDRIKMFRMGIPMENGNVQDLCFRVPDKKGNERTRSVAMGNQVESMTCADFQLLVAKYGR